MSLRILDYGSPNPFGEIIGKPKKLAWPVNVYRVTLPEPDNSDGPNMFERVILKIIDACGIREAGALAEEICIPEELVKFVLLRLRDKAFIDENNEIINQSRDKWMMEKEPVYITALVFKELATGKILPFLHLLNNENPLKKEDKENKGYWKIRYNESHKVKMPEPHDVNLALQAMKKRSVAHANYPRLPAIGQIKIFDGPELYYLYCPIAIQKSNSNFRIADPFGNGFSLLLENSFRQLLEQDENEKNYLIWQQRLSNPNPNKPADTFKEPFDNDENRGRCRKLVYVLGRKEDTPYRSDQIYSALEWALFYTCIQRQYSAAVSELKFTNPEEQSKLLREAAEKIGLDFPVYGLSHVPEGKFVDFHDGKAEMATVLAITLLMAESDQSHPLHKIARVHPDFIIRLLDIRNKRGQRGHGKGKLQTNGVKLRDEDFMREIVTALLPNFRFSNTPAAAIDEDSAADMMLDSRTNIQCEFGLKYFNRLGTDMQDRLINAERLWLSLGDKDDARAFVFDLYAVLQAMFRTKLVNILPPDINDSEFTESAQKKTKDAGLERLPDYFSGVKPFRIRQALQGNDPTFGACVVAFLIVSDEYTLKAIPQIQPSFLSDIVNIIDMRGHGNEPLFLEKKEIKKLRDTAYLTIKTLLEV